MKEIDPISLKEYIESILAEREKQADQKFQSLAMAVSKAEVATEKRFESVNEFRATLTDQQRTFIPRAEYESAHKALTQTVTDAKERLDKIENMKQGGQNIWIILVGVSGFVMGIISFVLGLLGK
jgi:signal recognition particle GTPase